MKISTTFFAVPTTGVTSSPTWTAPGIRPFFLISYPARPTAKMDPTMGIGLMRRFAMPQPPALTILRLTVAHIYQAALMRVNVSIARCVLRLALTILALLAIARCCFPAVPAQATAAGF